VRYFLSLTEQGLTSLLSLGLSFWLIRASTGDVFGLYSFWVNVVMILTSLQNAVVVCHLLALPPGLQAMPRRIELERVLLAVNFLLLAMVALGAAGMLLWSWLTHSLLMQPAIIVFLPAFLLYQYARSLAFSRGRVLDSATLAMTLVVCCVVLLALDHFLMPAPETNRVLLLLGFVYGVCGAIWLWRLSRGIAPNFRQLRQQFRPYLMESRWTLLGVSSIELLTRFPSFVIMSWFGPLALGRFSATILPARPAGILAAAWMPVARADMVGHRDSSDRLGFMLSLARGLFGASLIGVLWTTLVMLGWPQVVHFVLSGRFADARFLALQWGIETTLAGIGQVFSVGLQALAAFRVAGVADAVGAAAAMAAVLLLLATRGPDWSVIGIIIGQIVQISMMAVSLRQIMRRTGWATHGAMAARLQET
jgi:hypothetical protein